MSKHISRDIDCRLIDKLSFVLINIFKLPLIVSSWKVKLFKGVTNDRATFILVIISIIVKVSHNIIFCILQ